MRKRLLICAGLICTAIKTGHCEDWPQFRGPNGAATSDESKLPTEWSSDKNVAWKVSLPVPVGRSRSFGRTRYSLRQQSAKSSRGPSAEAGSEAAA